MRIKRILVMIGLVGFAGASSYVMAQSYVYRDPAFGVVASEQSVIRKEKTKIEEKENIETCLLEKRSVETKYDLLAQYDSSVNHILYYDKHKHDSNINSPIGLPPLKNNGIYNVSNYSNQLPHRDYFKFGTQTRHQTTSTLVKSLCGEGYSEAWEVIFYIGQIMPSKVYCDNEPVLDNQIMYPAYSFNDYTLNTKDLGDGRVIYIYEKYDTLIPENPEKYQWCIDNGYETSN